MTTERDIALMVAAGDLPSPTVFMNNTFFACRFSGTGVAWRQSVGFPSKRRVEYAATSTRGVEFKD